MTVKDQKQTFFSKVSTRKERERAFVLMTDTKTDLECQLKDKSILILTANKLQDSNMVVLTDTVHVPLNEDVIITFNIGQEKYFMKTIITGHDFANHFCINLDAPLFKLQRRDSFRVNIPQGYLAKINVTQIDNQKISKKFPLFDLSGGGISFEIPPENNMDVVKDQLLYGEMEIGGKFKKPFTAVVRHCIRVGSQGSGLKKVGAEFMNMSPNEQQEIIKIVMDIHRDLFSKFKIGTR
jgi:c-di-GMP-binding flagellar brake protein YcgR